MSIKIERNGPNFGGLATWRVDLSSVVRSTEGERRADRRTDSVQHSSDAELTATKASALTERYIRQHKVDAARKALEAGRIGQHPYALADKLIDSLLAGNNE